MTHVDTRRRGISTRAHWRRRASGLIAAVATALGVGLTGAVPAHATAYVPIAGAGSTWASNAMQATQANVAALGMTVNYAATGSSDGRSQFRNGTVDFASSEIPYGLTAGGVADPPPATPFAYVPFVAGGIAFPYHVDLGGGQRLANLRLSSKTIAQIFTRVVTMWNDPAIAADNPGTVLPALAITPVVRGDVAAATLQLTQWMSIQQSAVWSAFCTTVGLTVPCAPTSFYPVIAGEVAVAGATGVTGYVAQSAGNGSITYVEADYARNAGLPTAKVLNASGYYTAPTAGDVAVTLSAVPVDATTGLADLTGVYNSSDPRAYPVTDLSYLIVPTSTTVPFTTAKGKTLGDLVAYTLCTGQGQFPDLGYSELPPSLQQAALSQTAKVPGADVSGVDLTKCGNSAALIAGTPNPQPCDFAGNAPCGSASGIALAISPGNGAATGAPITFSISISPVPADGGTVTVTGINPSGDVTPPAATVIGGSATVVTTILQPGLYVFTATFVAAPPGSQILVSASIPLMVIHKDPGPDNESITTVLPPGALVIAVSGDPGVVLPSPVLDSAGDLFTTSGVLTPLVVTDNRAGSPGWTVSGQDADFGDGAGHTIDGGGLGWAPSVIDHAPSQTVTLGPTVTSGIGGLKIARTLASATGLGTAHIGAVLSLDVPTGTVAGTYVTTLTLTAI